MSEGDGTIGNFCMRNLKFIEELAVILEEFGVVGAVGFGGAVLQAFVFAVEWITTKYRRCLAEAITLHQMGGSDGNTRGGRLWSQRNLTGTLLQSPGWKTTKGHDRLADAEYGSWHL